MSEFTENDSLESGLRRTRPVAPPARLASAISASLEPPTPVRPEGVRSRFVRVSLWASWSVTAAAAAVAIAVVLREPRAVQGEPSGTAALQQQATTPDPAQPAGSFKVMPVNWAGYLFNARDEGIVFLDDGRPARKVRYEFVDTFELWAPGGAGKVNVSYPREEIRMIPIRTM